MNQQKTVESRVLSILKDCPRARFDDMILIMHYYNRYATYLRAGELPLNDLACSTILPSTILSISIPVKDSLLCVGFIPIHSPS